MPITGRKVLPTNQTSPSYIDNQSTLIHDQNQIKNTFIEYSKGLLGTLGDSCLSAYWIDLYLEHPDHIRLDRPFLEEKLSLLHEPSSK